MILKGIMIFLQSVLISITLVKSYLDSTLYAFICTLAFEGKNCVCFWLQSVQSSTTTISDHFYTIPVMNSTIDTIIKTFRLLLLTIAEKVFHNPKKCHNNETIRPEHQSVLLDSTRLTAPVLLEQLRQGSQILPPRKTITQRNLVKHLTQADIV